MASNPLPTVGGDNNTWGTILNTNLESFEDGEGNLLVNAIPGVNGVTVSGTPAAGEVLTAASTTAATWQPVTATSLDGVTFSGTPTAGQIPVATSSTAATWQNNSGGVNGFNPSAVVTGTTHTSAIDELTLIDTTANACTVTLPTAPADMSLIAVLLVKGTYGVTVDRGGSDVFYAGGSETATTDTVSGIGTQHTYQYSVALGAWLVQVSFGVVIGGPVYGNQLMYNGSKWANINLLQGPPVLGMDPSGTNDNSAAITAAVTQLGGPGEIQVPWINGTAPAQYKVDVGNVVFGLGQGMVAPGSKQCFFMAAGAAGVCFAVKPSAWATSNTSGRFQGFTVNGANTTGASTGFSLGDMLEWWVQDVAATSFAGTGAAGFHFVNIYGGWSERGTALGLQAYNNTTGVVFDNGSFDYSYFDIYVNAAANQNGMTLQNTASIIHPRLFTLGGNFTGASSNTGYALGIEPNGGNTTGVSSIIGGTVNFACECGGTGVGHTSIVLAGAAGTRIQGNGTYDFQAAPLGFSNISVGNNSNVAVSGWVNIPGLVAPQNGDCFVTSGGIADAPAPLGTLSASQTIYCEGYNYCTGTMPNGAMAVTWYEIGTAHRKMTFRLQQPATGAAGTITASSTTKLAPGFALSGTNSAYNIVDAETWGDGVMYLSVRY